MFLCVGTLRATLQRYKIENRKSSISGYIFIENAFVKAEIQNIKASGWICEGERNLPPFVLNVLSTQSSFFRQATCDKSLELYIYNSNYFLLFSSSFQ